MKPCARNRKLIAWLALDELDPRKVTALRKHLAECEGCRRYWEEISNVTEVLTARSTAECAERPDANLEVAESFHRRVAEKLWADKSSSALENFAGWVHHWLLNWRMTLPAVAVLVLALTALLTLRHHPASSPPAPVQIVSAYDSGSDLAPTIANYQMVANQSLDKLDELLTRQGNKSLTPAPVYTASGLTLANGSF